MTTNLLLQLLFLNLFLGQFGPADPRSVKFDQVGPRYPIEVTSFAYTQGTLQSSVDAVIKNNSKVPIQAVVLQVEFLDERSDLVASALVIGEQEALGKRGVYSGLPNWVEPFQAGASSVGLSRSWVQWKSSITAGDSAPLQNECHEILRVFPYHARVAIPAFMDENGKWHQQSKVLRQRAIPEDLALSVSQYERLAKCCSKEDIVVSGHVGKTGLFQATAIRTALGEAAIRDIRLIVDKWRFKPLLDDGRFQEQDLTLVLRIAEHHPLSDAAKMLGDTAIMPVLISRGGVVAGPYSGLRVNHP